MIISVSGPWYSILLYTIQGLIQWRDTISFLRGPCLSTCLPSRGGQTPRPVPVDRPHPRLPHGVPAHSLGPIVLVGLRVHIHTRTRGTRAHTHAHTRLHARHPHPLLPPLYTTHYPAPCLNPFRHAVVEMEVTMMPPLPLLPHLTT